MDFGKALNGERFAVVVAPGTETAMTALDGPVGVCRGKSRADGNLLKDVSM